MDEEDKSETSYIPLLLGAVAIGGLYFLKSQKSTASVHEDNLQILSKSYKYDCDNFNILNKKNFETFHKLLVKKIYDSFQLPATKILNFENYILGYCDKYIKEIIKYKAKFCDLTNPNWQDIYYILCADAVKDLSTFLPGNEKEKYKNIIAPKYYGILVEYLDFDQDRINDVTELYMQYKETGDI